MTALAGQSALRLESYLMTAQSLAAARAHLAPGGTFSMYNYYQPFLLDRYATTLESVYHQAPCAQVEGLTASGRRLAVLTVHPGGPVANCAAPTGTAAGSPRPPTTTRSPTCGTPPSRAASCGCWRRSCWLSLIFIRAGGGRFTQMRGYLDLACMGAAFLLLETKNIVQFALLFGTTWFVNSLVFAGVLVAVYLAVETANRVRLPRPAVLYGALLAALVWPGWCPQESLLALPVVPVSSPPARWPSRPYSWRTSSSRSGSPGWRIPARPSR